jgi:U3 small nucleolar RNA-associated protein 21
VRVRSHLASLLQKVDGDSTLASTRKFQNVTEYLGTLGPSSIDVELSSLCGGGHDLEEGVPFLRLACLWLAEACRSGDRFEAVNAYLHRFLYLHATVIAEIERSVETDADEDGLMEAVRQERRQLLDAITDLRQAQQLAYRTLNDKMQNTLCLLRHFSRMV